jgi:SAM-dependent methyltransferase
MRSESTVSNHWNQWESGQRSWSRIEPPLRPNAEVVDAFQQLLGGAGKRVLLLGVTPELANAFHAVVAIDKSAQMIANTWPGNTAIKQAVLGDWLEMLPPVPGYDGVVGDGSLSNVRYPDQVRELLQRSERCLAAGGRFVCRLFERPDKAFNVDELRAVATAPAQINFHAFKWQVAMHLAGITQATVPVQEILSRFNELFPDRDALAARTGWARQIIDLIDVYEGSDVSFTFMSRQEIAELLPEDAVDVRFIRCGSYDLADRCPLLTFSRA